MSYDLSSTARAPRFIGFSSFIDMRSQYPSVLLSISVFMFPKARLLTFHTAGTIKSDHLIRRGRLPLRWRSIAHEILLGFA